jgi:hypothetical protein
LNGWNPDSAVDTSGVSEGQEIRVERFEPFTNSALTTANLFDTCWKIPA